MSEFNSLSESYDILDGVSMSFMEEGDFGSLLTSSSFPAVAAEQEVEVQSSQVVQGSQVVASARSKRSIWTKDDRWKSIWTSREMFDTLSGAEIGAALCSLRQLEIASLTISGLNRILSAANNVGVISWPSKKLSTTKKEMKEFVDKMKLVFEPNLTTMRNILKTVYDELVKLFDGTKDGGNYQNDLIVRCAHLAHEKETLDILTSIFGGRLCC
jgi:hypothetical protein